MNKIRKRKIKYFYKKAVSNYQCRWNSAGWIDPNGEIYWIPTIEDLDSDGYIDLKARPELGHGEWVMKNSDLIMSDKLKEEKDPSKRYSEWLKAEGQEWVKVSNSKEFSIYKGEPTPAQFVAFGKMHIECIKNDGAMYYSPDDIITYRVMGSFPIKEVTEEAWKYFKYYTTSWLEHEYYSALDSWLS